MIRQKPEVAQNPSPDTADDATKPPRTARKPGAPRPRSRQATRDKAASLSVLTDNVLAALTAAGGADYLLTIARDDPKTFCALLTRILPGRIDSRTEGGAIVLRWAIDEAGEAERA